MKMVCWNCQGLGNSLIVQALKALTAKEKPDFLFLMETKNPELVLQRLQRRLHFSHLFVSNSHGLAGGLSVFWNDNVSVDIISSSTDLFDIICRDVMEDKLMRVTCLHAPSSYQHRQLLWDQLRTISTLNNLPWICAGDFNEILYAWEKVGGRSPDRYRIQSFRDVINDCAFMEIESKGCKFTWSNNRDGPDQIKERLDRVLCTPERRILYPEAQVFALPPLGSDHSPIIISTSPSYPRGQRNFVFEAYWNQDPECRKVIATTWNSAELRNTNLLRKLRIVSSKLHKWSRSKFDNVQLMVPALQ